MSRNRIAIAICAGIAALAVISEEARCQSLWRKSGGGGRASFLAEPKARRLGDLLTILIEERQQVQSNEDAKTSKDQSLAFLVDKFEPKPDGWGALPDISQSSSRDWAGQASYSKDGRFEARIAAVVVDVQPNGNLVVEGRRRIQFDDEVKTIKVTGLVRPRDISSNNTVLSRFVANATLSYEGAGPLTSSTTKGWFEKIVDAMWPF